MNETNRKPHTSGKHHRNLSVIILAGGKSERMGFDKAFLKYEGISFIDRISNEMLNISDDLIISIGNKNQDIFNSFANDKAIRLVSDDPNYRISNPMSGILSSLKETRNPYAAILPCDSPRVRSKVIDYLFQIASNHSAAVPIWDTQMIEPLCAVYRTEDAMMAGVSAIQDNKIGPKYMISYLDNVQYVNVSRLRRFDPQLDSLQNINSRNDYQKLVSKEMFEESPNALANAKNAFSHEFAR